MPPASGADSGAADSSGSPDARRIPAWLMVVAIVALAFSLRPAVNSLGAVLPQIRVDLDLTATSAGFLNALPALVFAFGGILTPALAARLGAYRLVVVALIVAVAGQLLRAQVNGVLALFAGTLLTLAGLSAGNVLMPGFIRQHFPERITTLTSLYITVMSLGATLGSGATIPLQNAFDGSWRTGFTAWAFISVAAMAPWLLVVFRAGGVRTVRRVSEVPLRRLLRLGLPWAMAGFFALQGAQVYVAVGWLGQVILDAGIDAVQMGVLLAMGPAIGIALSLIAPTFMRGERNIRILMVFLPLCYVIGYGGLLLAPAGGAWVWMFFVGVGGGTFPVALTLIALRARTPDGVIALSAFTQCIGYLLSSIGPLIFGLLHDVADSWTPSLILMMVSLVPMGLIGIRLARTRYVEDQLGID